MVYKYVVYVYIGTACTKTSIKLRTTLDWMWNLKYNILDVGTYSQSHWLNTIEMQYAIPSLLCCYRYYATNSTRLKNGIQTPKYESRKIIRTVTETRIVLYVEQKKLKSKEKQSRTKKN